MLSQVYQSVLFFMFLCLIFFTIYATSSGDTGAMMMWSECEDDETKVRIVSYSAPSLTMPPTVPPVSTRGAGERERERCGGGRRGRERERECKDWAKLGMSTGGCRRLGLEQ